MIPALSSCCCRRAGGRPGDSSRAAARGISAQVSGVESLPSSSVDYSLTVPYRAYDPCPYTPRGPLLVLYPQAECRLPMRGGETMVLEPLGFGARYVWTEEGLSIT